MAVICCRKSYIYGSFIACFAIAVYFYYNHFPDKTIPIAGYFDVRFRPVAELFKDQVWSGASRGCSLSVYYRNELVVDLWGGYSDYEFKVPWRNYTLTNVVSVTKAIAAIGVALLVQRGQLNYSHYVWEYWPEFAQNGKENITVAMLLSHQAGLLGPAISIASMKNMSDDHIHKLDKKLVEETPSWPPGTQFGYSAATYGLYLDALVRRVDHQNRTAARFFHEEVALPFDIDFYIGLPREMFYRKSRSDHDIEKIGWYFEVFKSWRYTKLAFSTFFNPYFQKMTQSIAKAFKTSSHNDPEIAAIPFASGNGYGTTKSVAKLFSYLATTHSNDLLTADMIDFLSQPIVSGIGCCLGVNATYSLGTWIMKNVLGEDVVGHTGFGGQLAYADRKHHMSLAYLTNDYTVYVIGGDPKVTELEKLLYKIILDDEEAQDI